MARVQISMPEKFAFTTHLQVRLADVAGGLHLGNHMVISFLNEAMFLFLRDNGFPTLDIEGRSLINADLAIVYQSESMMGDNLKIEVAIDAMSRCGCDFYYRLTNERTGKPTAVAKMAMLFFDYEKRKISKMPDTFRSVFEQYCSSS